ncbi:hypothetical protein MJ561_05995 [Klebsiella pneumoniae]|nr:hypothetical protein MJ561_05995 [Klebsiella pneumoniae]
MSRSPSASRQRPPAYCRALAGRKLKKLWQELGAFVATRRPRRCCFYGETPIAAADDLFVTTEGEVKDGGRGCGWRKTGD